MFTVGFRVIEYQSLIFEISVSNLTLGSFGKSDFLSHELFCCASGVSNEARFVFTVQSIVMPQKLKGTLAFIVKVSKKTDTYTH